MNVAISELNFDQTSFFIMINSVTQKGTDNHGSSKNWQYGKSLMDMVTTKDCSHFRISWQSSTVSVWFQ